jgi:hypothetical protein
MTGDGERRRPAGARTVEDEPRARSAPSAAGMVGAGVARRLSRSIEETGRRR